jgi:DNA-binding transcriptional ArsR family regulator
MTDDHLFAQRYLACVGDPSRFRILVALARGEECVTELARQVGLSQSCTTRHLQALRGAGVVDSDRRGKQVYFRLESESGSLHPVLSWALGAARDVDAERLGAGREELEWKADHSAPRGHSTDDGRPARRRRSETRPRRTGASSQDGSSVAFQSMAETHRPAEHEGDWTSDAGPARADREDESRGDAVVDSQSLDSTRGYPPQELDDFLL